MELKIQVRARPGYPVLDQFDVDFGYLRCLVPEDMSDLPFDNGNIALVDFSENTQRKHVLAQLGVVYDCCCFFLNGHHDKAVVLRGHLLHGRRIFLPNQLFFVVFPHAFQKNDAIILHRMKSMAGKEYLFIEGDNQLRLVAPVTHLFCAESYDISRSACDMPGRGFDFSGNNLYRPDPVTHFGAGLAKNLGTFLGAFARVGDNLNGMLR